MSSSQPAPRTGKRAAAAAADDFENDDGFVFTRKAKKPRKSEVAAAEAPPVRRSPRNKAPEADKTIPTTTTTTTTTSISRNSATRAATSPSRDAERRRAEKSSSSAMRSSRDPKTDKTSSRRADTRRFESPPPQRQHEQTTIALPTSDTPVNARNKEMRKKAAEGTSPSSTSNRRSSLDTRGRRASSLMESGQPAMPHRDVDAREFYKHISPRALLEPQRMRQLLVWCSRRAMPEKVPQGVPSTDPTLGARMIQDELDKEFSSRSDFSNWFARDESVAPAGRALRPNPRNIELDKRMASLEARIQRLQEEKNTWQSLQKPAPEQPQLFPDTDNSTQDPPTADTELKIQLPDIDLLDDDERGIHRYLATELEPLSQVRARTETRLKNLQRTLEFDVDRLADGAHKLEQRVRVAGRQADAALRIAAARLKRREGRERRAAGTGEMPMMEVLRSLGSLLPEGGGGGMG